MQFGTREGVQREKMSLQSMARWMINMAYLTKNPGRSSRPVKHDELSFWSHRIIYLGATAHIKLGEREPGWREGLECMKEYWRFFEPRFRLHGMVC